MELFRRVLAVAFALCMLFGLSHCGRRGTPSGGPKDVTPPVLIKAEPVNESTNFTSRRIRLYFDHTYGWHPQICSGRYKGYPE